MKLRTFIGGAISPWVAGQGSRGRVNLLSWGHLEEEPLIATAGSHRVNSCPTSQVIPAPHPSPVPVHPQASALLRARSSSSDFFLTQGSSRVVSFGWGFQLALQSLARFNFQQGKAQHHQLISLCLTSSFACCLLLPPERGGAGTLQTRQ